jgi:hypothetical protein
MFITFDVAGHIFTLNHKQTVAVVILDTIINICIGFLIGKAF